jgi:hypothetical protein
VAVEPVVVVPVVPAVEVVVDLVVADPVDVAGRGLVTVTIVFDDPQPANSTAAAAMTIPVQRTAGA